MNRFAQQIILITGIVSSMFLTAQASHIVGGYASYSCLGGNTYKLSYTIYFECPYSVPASEWSQYKSTSGCGPPFSTFFLGVQIPYVSLVEYSSVLLCSSLANNNACTGGTNPNIGVIKYETTVTFPNQCNDWVFYQNNVGNAILNTFTNVPMQNPGLYTWIDNTNGNCNNSVLFDDLAPVFYTCVNKQYSEGTGAYDPDGDSLIYHIVPAVTLSGNMAYTPPWNGTDPIPGITIDTLTGKFTFTPTTVGSFYMAINVDEYDRTTKAFKGSTIKQFSIFVQPCTNNPPDPTTGIVTNLAAPAIKTGPYSIELTEGDSLSFQIPVTDPDIGNTVSFYTGLIQTYLPGATTSVLGANTATLTIKWKAPVGSAGNTIYLAVNATDDACPMRALTTFIYTIKIKAKAVNVTQASADVKICKGKSVSLSATGGTSFTWTALAGGDPINVPLNFSCNPCANPVASPTVTTSYKVTSDLSSNNKDTVVVTVNNLPVVNAGADVTNCNGSNTTLSATSGLSAYLWSPATGLNNAAIAAPVAKPTITTTYTLTATNVNGCTNTDNVKITVDAVNITASADTSICQGGSTSLSVTGTGTSFTWIPAAGLSSTSISNPSASPNVTTTYTVTTSNINACSAVDSVKVTVNALPAITFVPASPAILCSGSSITLTASGAATYIWSPTTGISPVTGSVVTANPAASATYTVTGTSALLCVNTATINVVVDSVPTVSIAPVSPAALCLGSSITLTAAGAVTYAWSPATSLNATTGSVVKANPTSPITYTVTGTSALSCMNTATINVTVNAVPTVSVVPAAPTTLCSGSSITLAAAGAATYAWSPATGLNTSTGPDVTATPPANTTYTVTGTDINGCTGNQTVTLTAIGPAITLTASPVIITSGDSSKLHAAGGDIYLWSPSAGLSCNTCADPTATPDKNTDYCVTVTDANGCTDNACITINVDIPCGTLFIPNAFSPNGDGENDTLKVYMDNNCIKDFHLVIFDRWGENVFESTDQKTGWDGMENGELLNTAVFAYYLNATFINGESINKKGNVSLMR